MQKSQSLKSRKFANIIIPKTLENIENNNEIKESEKNNKKIKRIKPEIPDLHLPVKRISHVTNRRDKNKKINKISLEKLKQIVINIRMNKKEKNHDKKNKNLIHIKRTINTAIKNNINTNNINIKPNCKTITNKNKKNINYNNNTTSNNTKEIKEFNYNTENILQNNEENENENSTYKEKERSQSIKTDINNCTLLKNDLLQIRNENKKLYDRYDINYLTEKYNDFILTTENLEKNLINKYLNGTDNIISEIEEPQYLKEDSEINTLNANISLKKHLSIRETTLDSSCQGNNSYYNRTDKLNGKTNGLVRRKKNYKQIFKKYRTNLNIKYSNKMKNTFNNKYYKEKRRSKIPSLNKNNTHNNSGNNDTNKNNSVIGRLSYNRINSFSINLIDNLRDSKNNNSKQKSISVYKNRRNKKNKNGIGESDNQFLSIINEANDLIKSECKKRYCRPKSKNTNENRFSYKKRYNAEYIKNKFKKIQQSINDINPINLFFTEKNYLLKSRYNTSHINNNINSYISDYEIGPNIGMGSYAEVKLGIHKKTRKKYAIKIYPKSAFDDEDKKNSIKNEIYILNQLNHENIMKLYDIINTPKYFYLILEYINGISLLDYIQKLPNKRIEENLCKKIFYQIVTAIHYCSQKNIYHRDIKLENILIIKHETIKVKLIDFGFAIKCNKKEFQKFFCGTLYYMAPEIINKKKYLPYYSDIWSLGVLLYTMIYGRFPFNERDEDKLFDLINEGKFYFPEDIETSDEVKNLIKKIIVVEPCKRANFNDIINDVWFKN